MVHGFTAPPLDLPTMILRGTTFTAVYVICCTVAVLHGGWVDRFLGVTVILRSAVLL